MENTETEIPILILVKPNQGHYTASSSAGGPGFNHQSRTAPYQRRYTNGTTEHSKGNILALSQELR